MSEAVPAPLLPATAGPPASGMTEAVPLSRSPAGTITAHTDCGVGDIIRATALCAGEAPGGCLLARCPPPSPFGARFPVLGLCPRIIR